MIIDRITFITHFLIYIITGSVELLCSTKLLIFFMNIINDNHYIPRYINIFVIFKFIWSIIRFIIIIDNNFRLLKNKIKNNLDKEKNYDISFMGMYNGNKWRYIISEIDYLLWIIYVFINWGLINNSFIAMSIYNRLIIFIISIFSISRPIIEIIVSSMVYTIRGINDYF